MFLREEFDGRAAGKAFIVVVAEEVDDDADVDDVANNFIAAGFFALFVRVKEEVEAFEN